MDPPVSLARGADALLRLLDAHTSDLRTLDLAGFRRWLHPHLERWGGDPVFAQRARIRDLRRAHPRLAALERALRRAAADDEAGPHFAELERVERELEGAGKALTGLTAALEAAAPGERPRLREKLRGFEAKQAGLRSRLEDLVGSSPARQALLRVRAELRRLRSATGLEREEARLEELLRGRGQRSGRSGSSFEQLARAAAERLLLPTLRGGGAGRETHLLTGVTLGAARTELDQLLVRRAGGDGEPVEVLAVVEVKRNINDLAHGFRRRQEDLAWLTGEADAYDPAEYRTRHFGSGHFDRAAVHRQDGESFRFERASFRRFRRDPATGLFLDGLHLITREGSLWGVSAAALARIGHRVATDRCWDAEDPVYLGELLRWCQALAHPLEAPDVLRVYAADPERARQIVLMGR